MKKLVVIFFLAYSSLANAEKFYLIKYTIKDKETFASILKKFVRKDSIINAKTSMVKKTISRNKHVKNWRKLIAGTVIKLYISPRFLDIKKYKRYKEKNPVAKKEDNLKDEKKIEKARPEGWTGNLFYMASYGQFTQNDPQTANITFLQNSPFSLGGAFGYYPKKANHSYSMSLYLSYLLGSSTNLSLNEVDIPPEIGANFYWEYKFLKKKFNFYGGLDFERFSSFNMGQIKNTNSVYVDQSSVAYVTIGVAKLFSLFKKRIYTKWSFSQSVYTSSSYDTNSIVPAETTYSGFKILGYFNYKFSKRWFSHMLLKFHKMSGPSELQTLRIGVGFGHILF